MFTISQAIHFTWKQRISAYTIIHRHLPEYILNRGYGMTATSTAVSITLIGIH
jgi:hypothetical protein